MIGGGGFVIALVMAIGAIVGARALSAARTQWKTVSLAEFDAFVRKYLGPCTSTRLGTDPLASATCASYWGTHAWA